MSILLELCKIKITIPIAATTFLGYFLKTETFNAGLLLTTAGLFLLSCASAALNHLQDKDIDALMSRTRHRPLPSQRISETAVMALIAVEFLLGSLLLFYGSNLMALTLGWFALFWYNAIYTPLKRHTALAVLPGAFIGALPPVVGWVAAGGGWFERPALLLGGFMFLWQIPHFWMLLVQKTQEYKTAGLPTLSDRFSLNEIRGFILFSIALMLGSALAIPYFNVMAHDLGETMVYVLVLGLLIYYGLIHKKRGLDFTRREPFVAINLFALTMLVFVFLDALIS
jgi:protoheme IX farnesyltransferase